MVRHRNSNSQSKPSSDLRRTKNTADTESKSLGRPRDEITAFLTKFIKNSKQVKLEVLTNAAFRKLLRKIEDFCKGKPAYTKLVLLNPYLGSVDRLIATHKRALEDSIEQWKNSLSRGESEKNRQFNKHEIRDLFSSSKLCLKVYKAFIEGIVSSENPIKCQVMNLDYWPEGGDRDIKRILLDDCSNSHAQFDCDMMLAGLDKHLDLCLEQVLKDQKRRSFTS
jgi:hypothetical protein